MCKQGDTSDLRAKRSNDLEEIASWELQNRVLSVEENGHAAVDGAVAQDAEERDIKKPVLALWPTLTRRREEESIVKEGFRCLFRAHGKQLPSYFPTGSVSSKRLTMPPRPPPASHRSSCYSYTLGESIAAVGVPPVRSQGAYYTTKDRHC